MDNTFTLGPLECLTTAPEDYDYGWARTVQHNVATDDRGKVYRLVRNEDDYHFRNQVARYGSGMNPTIDEQKDLDGRIRLGFLTLTPDLAIPVHYLAFDFRLAVNDKEFAYGPLSRILDTLKATDGIDYDGHSLTVRFRAVGDSNRDRIIETLKPFNVEPVSE